jgi:hypothetical protein
MILVRRALAVLRRAGPPAMILVRRALAVLLAVGLITVFPLAMGARLFAREVADPRFVPRLLAESELYDLLYDAALDAVLTDLVAQGVDLHGTDHGVPIRLRFEEPEKTKRAARKLIEGIFPRAYVQRELEETLSQTVPYFAGSEVVCNVDWESADRLLALPAALRAASAERSIGAIINRDVVPMLVRNRADHSGIDAMGVSFTADEGIGDLNRLLPADWVEPRFFEVADVLAPYLAGRTESFDLHIPLDDRVAIAGEILKEKAADENVITGLILETVRSHASQALGRAMSNITDARFPWTVETRYQDVRRRGLGKVREGRGFFIVDAQHNEVAQFYDKRHAQLVVDTMNSMLGVGFTREEIARAAREAPRSPSMIRQSDAAVDAVVAYLVSRTGHLSHTVDLRAHREAAVAALRQLARQKGGEAAKPSAVRNLDRIVSAIVPERFTVTDADLRMALGPDAFHVVEEARDWVGSGSVLTPEVVLRVIPDPEQRAHVQRLVSGLRAGARWDQADFEAQMDPFPMPVAKVLDKARDLGQAGFLSRSLSFLMLALPLLAIGMLGGRSWEGRMMWSGVVLVIAWIIFAITLQAVSDWLAPPFCDWFRAQAAAAVRVSGFPATARLIDSDDIRRRLLVVLDVVLRDCGAAARTWLVAGVVLCAASVAGYARAHARRANGRST